MSNFDNNMQITLSKVVSDNPNAPKLRVTQELNGVKYKAGLWQWTRKDGSVVTDKNGNTLYKGKLEVDDYKPNQASAPQPQAAAPDFDDDLPF